MKKRRIVLLIALIVFLTSIISCIVAYNYNYTYSSKLVAAIEDNDIEKLEDLLKKPGNVNSQPRVFSFDGTFPPISYAAGDGKYEMVKLLLENGADPNAKGVNSFTPLHLALNALNNHYSNRFDIAKLLIEYGANVNAVSSRGETVLEKVFKSIEKDDEIEELEQYEFLLYLIENDVDVYAKPKYNDSIMYYTARVGNTMACKLLIEEYSFDINHKDNKNNTILMEAADNYYNNPNTVSYLLEMGADPNIINSNNKTAYDIAVENESYEIADLIKSYM